MGPTEVWENRPGELVVGSLSKLTSGRAVDAVEDRTAVIFGPALTAMG